MDTQAALLRAIIDEPHDDTHRLVFADWLEDEGQGEWAALIRSQCTLQRLFVAPTGPFDGVGMTHLPTLAPAIRVRLLQGLGALQEAAITANPPSEDLRRFDAWVRRGFVEAFQIHGGIGLARFIRDGGEIFEQMPLTALRLFANAPGNWVRPFDGPHSNGMIGEYERIGPTELEGLICMPSFGRLRHLDLRFMRLEGPERRVLQRTADLFPTTTVWVSGWMIGDSARVRRLQSRLGARLIVDPAHPGIQMQDDIPF